MNRSVGQTPVTLKRAVFLVSFLCIAAQTIFSQPVVDSIRYIEPDQSILIVHLNENVSYTPTSPAATPDWVVYHNGIAYPAVYLDAQGVLDPPNIIRLHLDAPITSSEAHTGTGITVTYLGTGPPITGTSGNLAAFGPTSAINNLPMECEMFDPSRFDYSLSLTEVCAPASVEYTTAFYVQRHYLNSIHYDMNRVNIITRWGDGAEDVAAGAEVSPGRFQFTFNHTYPDDPSVCYWESFLLPAISGVGDCTGGGLRKTFVYENHSTDDEGDGIFRFHTDTIRVCLGQDVSEVFTDATYFNCNPQTEPDFANDGLRAVRFTYGTNVSPEPRIQDIYVDGNLLGAPVTDPIVYYDSIRSTGVPAPAGWHVSDPISHAFNAGTDAIGQVFEIQMENWGPCNNIFLNEPPIITYAYIKFVEGPIANPGPDFTICADASATMAGAIEQTSTGGNWSTNSGDGTWTNPELPTGAVYTPGPNDLVNGGVWLVLTADDGPGGCPEHQDSMYLSFEPALDPGNISGSQSLCQGDDAAAFTSTAPATGGVAPTYQWYTATAEAGPYTEMTGETGTTIDEGVLSVGNYYYFRQARSAGVCDPVNTDTLSIIVNPGPPSTPQNPVNDSPVCQDGTVVVDVDDATNATEYIWDVSWDGVPDDEDTVTTASEVTFDLTGVAPGTYTVKVLARNSCGDSPWSVTTSIVIHPTPNALPTPPTQTIADSAATDILMGGDVTGTIFHWRVLDPGTTNATDGGPLNIGDRIQQTLYNTTSAPVSVTYRIGPTANGCPGDSADVEVIVDPSVDMTVDNNSPDICTGSSTDIDVSSSVSGTTFSWTVTDPNNLGAQTDTNVGPNTGITIQDALVNTGTEVDSVIYHITPTGPAPTNITGTTQDIKVYVYPEPVAEPVNHLDSICNGTQTNIEMAADVAGSTFTWTVNDPGGTSGATASASAVAAGFRIQQTLDNTGNTPITVEYIITPTGPAPGSCQGNPVTVEVVVDPTPVANINNTAPEICSEVTTDIILNATVANSTFTWLMADPKGTGAVGGSGAAGDSISQQLVNTTQSPVDVIWEIHVNGPAPTACPGTTVYENVTVNPLPEASPVTGTDTVCEQTDNVIFQTSVAADSYVEWFVPASLGTRTLGGSGIGSNAVVITTADIPGPGSVTDSLWVLETNTYSCTNDTTYKVLTLVPNPDPSVITGNENVCAYTTHTYSVPGNPGSSYQWYIPQGAGFATDPTLHEVEVTFGLLSGQVRVTETTQGGCTTNHLTKDITVNPLPVSTLNVDKPVICAGELVTFTAGPLSNVSNYEFFLNSTSVQSGTGNTWSTATLANDDTVRVNVTSTNGCAAFAPPVIMTVQPEPVVTLTSSAPANTICAGGSVTFEATSADAVLYNFFLNGVSQQSGPLYFWTTSPGTISDGDEVYVAVQNAAGCSGASDTITTTVNPAPVAGIDGDHTVCPGTTVDIAVSVTTGVSPYTITIDNGIGTITNYLDGTNIQVTPTTSTIYSLTEITDANGCTSTPGPNLTGTAVVTHLDTVQIITQPRTAEVCEGIDTSFTVGATGAGLTYEWFTAASGADPFTPVSASNSATLEITAPTAAADGTHYYVVVSGTCDSEVSDTVELEILSGATVARGPLDTAVCEDLATGFGVDASATEDAAFQWYLSTDNGATWSSLADTSVYTGTGTDSLKIASAGSRFNGYMYYAEIIGICGGSVPSSGARLTVYERPEILAFPDDVTICEGASATFSIDAGVTSDPVFSWYVDMRDGTGWKLIGTDSAGVYQGSATATLTVLNAGPRFNGYRYHAMVVSGLSCAPPQVSSSALLSVHETPQIVVQPENDTVCEFGTAAFSVNATGGGLSYQWYESTDGGATFSPVADTGFYIGAGQPNMLIFNVPRTYDSYLYRVVVSGTCVPEQQSDDVSLTVHTSPVITAAPVDLTVCDGEQAVFSVVAEGTGIKYQWKVNRNDGSGYVNIQDTDPGYTGAQTPTLTKLTTDAVTENGFSYRVQVYGPCSPAELTDPVFLNVNSYPQINVQPVDAAVCAGEPVQFSASASGPDLVFRWMVSTDGGSSWTALSDDDLYDGTGNDQLWISNTTPAMDGHLYRLDVSSSCAPTATDVVELRVWENPAANITGDLAGFPQLCGGDLLTMDGNPTGGSGTYATHRWSGDVLHVSPTDQQTAQFQTYVKGDYNINYTVTDNRGCAGSASVVLRNFSPTAEFTSDASPSCGDLLVNFTNRSSSDAVSFEWDFGNGATSKVQHPSQTFTNDDPTSLVAYYNVLMVATDAQGCRDTARSLVTIYPQVDPSITATPQSGCQPLDVLLETKPGAASYLWDYGDGTGENGSYATRHVYTNLGTTKQTYQTVLQTTSAYGCMATDTVEIVVDPVPHPNFVVSPDIQIIPESGVAPVTFTNLTADGPWTFEYAFGDGSPNHTTTSTAPVEHTYTAAGIYKVTLYTSVGECIDSASTVVTINPRPPEASFTSITEGCHPLEVTFTNTSKNADSYTWQFGDGDISTEEHPVHIFYQPGEYTVKLFAQGPGGNDQASEVITVHPTPQVFFNYAPDSVFVNDKPVRFFNLTSYADDYYWDFGDVSEFDGEVDSENNSTLMDPLHVYMYEGWKDVLLIASNPHCVDSLFIPMAVKVIPAGVLQFPDIFRPGDAPVSGVNVNDLADAERNTIFFPGVNRQVLEYRLYIYNRWGELIFESDDINTGWDGFVQGRKAAQGVYIWKVTGIYSNGSPFSDAGDVTLVWQ
ncbi:MAG: PKD domain-containing protein [Bacteroidales bacterium]|nr:PKD domain-containing protein [Bacteroidales bacterium]